LAQPSLPGDDSLQDLDVAALVEAQRALGSWKKPSDRVK